ncbi:MAG: twin-arginine translocation signal domain-containing protein, partial [Armatimonadota bacterium]|nr:twin-arginine translocation signal domain-containing protein [bacterium]MDW8321116.1 twin-arginine translocation signal domain-containing protein [Armatimonadota bacterium]
MNPCKTCPLSRRQFLRAAGGAIGAWMLLPLTEPVFAAAPKSKTPVFPKGKPRVCVVFSHLPPEYPTWPSVGYDYEGRKKELSAKLQQACPNIR